MEEKEILSVSLASLMKKYPPYEEDLCYEGCILGQREVQKSDDVVSLFRFPTRINAFGAVFCSKGSISTAADLRHYDIGQQTIFVCQPGTIVQVESQEKAEVRFILCEEEFINRIHIDQNLLLHLFVAVRENPCLKLTDAEWDELMRTFDEVVAEGHSNRRDRLSIEIVHTLFRTLAYRLCRVLESRMNEQPGSTALHSRNTLYFNAFLEELSKNYMQERSVGFYAERLHLTPKYLTTLLRTTTGRTASEWIDDYVVLEAKNLLKYSTMNIQEIAYYLNFPNQSFFGRYFKQHTGMSPTTYRASK